MICWSRFYVLCWEKSSFIIWRKGKRRNILESNRQNAAWLVAYVCLLSRSNGWFGARNSRIFLYFLSSGLIVKHVMSGVKYCRKFDDCSSHVTCPMSSHTCQILFEVRLPIIVPRTTIVDVKILTAVKEKVFLILSRPTRAVSQGSTLTKASSSICCSRVWSS